MKVMIIVGARPNFMKAAPLISAIEQHNRTSVESSSKNHPDPSAKIHPVLLHTGQHYDKALSDSFFADLGLPKPELYLGVGSGSHASQTAVIMKRFEEVVLQERPDVIIVVGDVNSTLACALVAAKISFDEQGTRPLIAHVEAGLRSFDRSMPEEINRIVTDHLSDLLFVTEESGIRNLQHEGIPNQKIHFVGNTMIDSLLTFKDKADSSPILDNFRLRNRDDRGRSSSGVERYALLTLHRPSNVDHRQMFLNILEGMRELASSIPIIFPAHPRTRKRIAEFNLGNFFTFGNPNGNGNELNPIPANGKILLIDPLGYLDFLCLMKHAALVLTDSGGIQEETTCLGIPCVTVRENTERPVTLLSGTNVLAGVNTTGIRQAIARQTRCVPKQNIPQLWDGQAATRIIKFLSREQKQKKSSSNTGPSQKFEGRPLVVAHPWR